MKARFAAVPWGLTFAAAAPLPPFDASLHHGVEAAGGPWPPETVREPSRK